MKQSNFLSLGWRDFLRGLVIAILTPAVTIITDSLDRGEFNLNWRLIVLSSVGGFLAYLLKNLVTKPDSINDNAVADVPPEEPIDGSRPGGR